MAASAGRVSQWETRPAIRSILDQGKCTDAATSIKLRYKGKGFEVARIVAPKCGIDTLKAPTAMDAAKQIGKFF
jgi:hypothetical protein